MSEHDFDRFLTALTRQLRLRPEQKAAISDELRDHFEERLRGLMLEGVPHEEAVRRALAEFGDAVGLARQFTSLSRRPARRWIMRCTLATAVTGAAVLLMLNAFTPQPQRTPLISQLSADDGPSEQPRADRSGLALTYVDPAAYVPPPLTRPVEFQFTDTPLEEVLATIVKQLGLNIVIDTQAFRNVGVSPDVPITETATGEPLYLVLNRMFDNIEGVTFAWLLEDEVLKITTAEVAENDDHLVTRTYPVGDLLQNLPREQIVKALEAGVEGPWFDTDGIGGTMSLIGNVLTVRQTQRMQLQVQALLTGLRTAAPIVAVFEPPQHERILQALEQETDLQFVGSPLTDVVASVSREHQIPVRIDIPALNEVGIEPTHPVSLAVSGIRLRSALKILGESGDLQGVSVQFIPWNGVLWLTTAEVAEGDDYMLPRIYDLSPMVSSTTPVEDFMDLIQSETEGPWFDLDGIGGVVVALDNGRLLVRQTRKAHDEVAQLLAQHLNTLTHDEPAPAADPDELITEYYTMDATTADDLLLAIPGLIAEGTWIPRATDEGQVETKRSQKGRIYKVSAGTRQMQVGPRTPRRSDVDAATARDDVVVIPQAVLVVMHTRDVQEQVRQLLRTIDRKTAIFGHSSFFGGQGLPDRQGQFSIPVE